MRQGNAPKTSSFFAEDSMTERFSGLMTVFQEDYDVAARDGPRERSIPAGGGGGGGGGGEVRIWGW